MRVVFGVVGLLVVVAVVGILARKQLGAIAPVAAPPPIAAPGSAAPPTGTPQQQVRQVEQALQGAMQQARPVDDTQ